MTLESLKARARQGGVPILDDDTLEAIQTLISVHQVTTLLELGSGIGYSACAFAYAHPQLKIQSLEQDEARVKDATNNAEALKLSDRVQFVHANARTVDPSLFHTVDCLFIDAAKAHQAAFLDRFFPCVKPGGLILIDNIALNRVKKHTQSRAARALLRKSDVFKANLIEDSRLDCTLHAVGDTLAVCIKKEVTR